MIRRQQTPLGGWNQGVIGVADSRLNPMIDGRGVRQCLAAVGHGVCRVSDTADCADTVCTMRSTGQLR